MTRIFVYGTLMEGERNHEKYLGHLKPIATGVTLHGWYFMKEFNSVSTDGEFSPRVYKTKDEPGFHVKGEIYEVDDSTLARLDELEKKGIEHDRITAKVKPLGASVEVFDVQMYVHTGYRQPHDGSAQFIHMDNLTNTVWWDQYRSTANKESVAVLTSEIA